MSSEERSASPEHIITADELRQMMTKNEMERAENAAKSRHLETQKHTLFAAQFMHENIGPKDMEQIRRAVMSAVKDGKTEALVYTFPSELCTDHGRAINNDDPDWPETLQGQARRFYERWETEGKPNGYRLKAMIIDFPHDLPGNVGFFLSWAPTHF